MHYIYSICIMVCNIFVCYLHHFDAKRYIITSVEMSFTCICFLYLSTLVHLDSIILLPLSHFFPFADNNEKIVQSD